MWREALPEIATWAREVQNPDIGNTLAAVVEQFLHTDPLELERTYVETFDFNDKRALYLTAHEFGDSRDRGPALIELRRLLREHGFEEADHELPDHLPLLFEFLAVTAASPDNAELERRLARVCGEIEQALPEGSPYRPVFRCANAILETTGPAEFRNPSDGREAADLDELPYPLYYE